MKAPQLPSGYRQKLLFGKYLLFAFDHLLLKNWTLYKTTYMYINDISYILLFWWTFSVQKYGAVDDLKKKKWRYTLALTS